ncbi:Beta-N-acetylhexosaminidase [Microbacterium oleivorans]|uniref:family 20 glycosylhydrolase n=1 Tax=Microbacterium oleivorans TaxID=273677 RepID=UPI000975F50E|nr:family 20 glycosylhydrolase [Microbacterium oleivorans]AZS44720.1 Beta-N-acetylhexosaminidase [Microbacterium oleivorans]
MLPLPLVPSPADVEVPGDAPFPLADAGVTGDPDAAAALRAMLAARTGLDLPDGDGIVLASAEGGPAESYRLEVSTTGIRITGADAAGLFYGVQTLGQLVRRDGERWVIPAVRIEDSPRFVYRGVMLDVARHFHDIATVRAYIDRAASLKLNVLHLHLSDDQGWRLELRSRPALTEKGSAAAVDGAPGGFYTQDDYRAIVDYAASRHMTVIPEFDMPGHTHAVGLAYPELAEAPVTDVITEGSTPVAGEPYTGTAVGFSSLRVHDEATYDFVRDVFGELAELTPGPWLHFGGDESLGTAPEDFAYFVARASAVIADLGKTPMAWHEAGAVASLAPGTVGQYWGFVTPTDAAPQHARAFAERGGRVVLSPADAIYLDMKPTADSALGLTWANGVTSLERAYAWEPSTVVEDLAEDAILGVEAPLWTETVATLADIDALAFPRIAAAAEIAWSPALGPERTWESFRSRVGGLGPLWTTLGIHFPALEEVPWTT